MSRYTPSSRCAPVLLLRAFMQHRPVHPRCNISTLSHIIPPHKGNITMSIRIDHKGKKKPLLCEAKKPETNYELHLRINEEKEFKERKKSNRAIKKLKKEGKVQSICNSSNFQKTKRTNGLSRRRKSSSAIAVYVVAQGGYVMQSPNHLHLPQIPPMRKKTTMWTNQSMQTNSGMK